MPSVRITEIKLPLDHSLDALTRAAALHLGVKPEAIEQVRVARRGYDARRKSDIHFVYSLDVDLKLEAKPARAARYGAVPNTAYKFVAHAPQGEFPRPVVIGTGPCGLFAALILAQSGFRPIIIERGRKVRERTKDTWGFWRRRQLQIESNVQFGEGGAGTFSDGKLWTQVKDPLFHGRKVLEEMVRAGAPEEILYVSKPHVGTFRLVKVVEFLREEIERLGGEFRFQTQVTGLHIEAGVLRGLWLNGVCGQEDRYPDEALPASERDASGEFLAAEQVILAVGHSARDTFAMLVEQGVYVEPKPFSVGFRIEHPQGLIDRARFGPFAGHKALGAADYKLVHHASNGRSVYSFCMCPGGTVVAATSEAGRVVTNGMSQYSRNERNANAGIVVGIAPEDFDTDMRGQALVPDHARGQVLAGVRFQRALESQAFALGAGTYDAPGQRVGDFLKSVPTTAFGEVLPSYKPGMHLTNLANPTDPALPLPLIEAMQEALPMFGRQIPGFDLPDALLTAVETRTSSPVRIRRHDARGHPARFQSINTEGLYPAGEGAGYAGGIMSAAIDGIQVAEAVALRIANSG
jgi:hypothetical protein